MDIIGRKEKNIHQLFRISVLIKGTISFFEIVAGILVFFITPEVINKIVGLLINGELAEEKSGFLTINLLHLANQYSVGTEIFIAFYLLSRGLIKFLLVVALLKNKLWAYPASIGLLWLFVAYQIYQIIKAGSVFIIALTIFDFFVIYFIWKEYKIVKRNKLKS